MRRRVVATLPKNMAGRELKLGPGGLRDIEFAVQLLQLVHGSADDRLRVPATLPALAALADGGYVGRADADDLAQAYRFLRQTEHLLQLYQLRRTHTLPTDPAVLRRLGRAMRKSNSANPVFPNGPLVPPNPAPSPLVRPQPGLGVSPGPAQPAPGPGRPLGPRVSPAAAAEAPEEAFTQAWTRHAQQVRRLHEKLFYRPLLDAVAKLPSGAARLTPEAARARLEALGYRDPAGALRHIEALTSGLRRRAAIQRTLLPVLLGWFADAAEPDAGLLAFRQVSEALGETPWFLRLLRDETKAAERIATVLASSRYATGLLLRAPEAVAIFADDAELVPKTADALRAEMMAAARRHAADPGPRPKPARPPTPPARPPTACQHRGRRRAGGGRHPLAPPPRAAAGRGGGRARPDRAGGDGRGADRDHHRDPGRRPRGGDREDRDGAARPAADQVRGDRDGPLRRPRVRLRQRRRRHLRATTRCPGLDAAGEREAADAAQAVGTELRRLLALPAPDPPLLVDADLRPEGKQGPLVRSLAACRAYYERRAAPWEFQALLRAEFAVGSAELGAEFIALADRFRYPRRRARRAPPCARSGGSRRGSRRSGSRAAPTGRCTSSSARAACPTWSGRCSCSSSSTATPSTGLRTTRTLAALDAAVAGRPGHGPRRGRAERRLAVRLPHQERDHAGPRPPGRRLPGQARRAHGGRPAARLQAVVGRLSGRAPTPPPAPPTPPSPGTTPPPRPSKRTTAAPPAAPARSWTASSTADRPPLPGPSPRARPNAASGLTTERPANAASGLTTSGPPNAASGLTTTRPASPPVPQASLVAAARRPGGSVCCSGRGLPPTEHNDVQLSGRAPQMEHDND